MKKLVICLCAWSLLATCLLPAIGSAEIVWDVTETLKTEAPVLDMAVVHDGDWLVVLFPAKVGIYSQVDKKWIKHIDVDEDVNRIFRLNDADQLALAGQKKHELVFIDLAETFVFDNSELPFQGPADAPVTMVVFSDYECPYCVRLEPFLKQLTQQFPDKLKVIHKQFPLNMHKMARPAAKAAYSAERQGKFWEYHDELNKNHRNLNEDKLRAIALQLQLDMDQFDQDRKDPTFEALIDRDFGEGMAAGVKGIPTIFVNGKLAKQRSSQGLIDMINQAAGGN